MKAKRRNIIIISSAVFITALVLVFVLIFLKKDNDNLPTADIGEDETKVTSEASTTQVQTTTNEEATEEIQSPSELSVAKNGQGRIVVIDAGHQSAADVSKEPNGPDSTVMKMRVSGGTHGTTTGVYEYVLNLDIALQLENELKNRGYTVYMVRTTNEVNISNMERALYANSVNADICVRIHANGMDDSSISGAVTLAPSGANPYVGHLAADSQHLSRCIIDNYCATTGMKNRGVSLSDTMTGINWCEMPVSIIELGFMTNPSDDINMQEDNYQIHMVNGIANGIDSYFGQP